MLREFYVQSTRRTKDGALTHQQAMNLIEAFLRFRVQEATLELMHAAVRDPEPLAQAERDAAIIEAARLAGCPVFLSEDLSDRQDYDGVRVENPF